jgi:hypothetical protein
LVTINSPSVIQLPSPCVLNCVTNSAIKGTFTVDIIGNVTISSVGAFPIVRTAASTAVNIANVTDSASTITGAVIVSGGIGAGNIFANSIMFANPLFTQTTISGYEYYSDTMEWIGPFTNPMSTTMYLSRLGNLVTIQQNSLSGACSNAGQICTTTTAIPFEFRPAVDGDASGLCMITHNPGAQVNIYGTWYVRADGFIEVWAGQTNISFFGIAGTAYIRFSGSYIIF